MNPRRSAARPRSFRQLLLSALGLGVSATVCCALASPATAQGLVLAWGDNVSGQCAVPALPPGMSYTGVAAGGWQAGDPFGLAHSPIFYGGLTAALRSDGAIVEWGNTAGVTALPPGLVYVDLAVGAGHTLALRSDGTVVAWGDNFAGQCNVPTLPVGLSYVEVAAAGDFSYWGMGLGHSVARRSDGSVVAWGANNWWGECDVPALPAGLTYVEVAAGCDDWYTLGAHTVARCSDGSVVAWGSNAVGQCNVPALPAGLRYVEVAAGAGCTLARRSDGLVVAWGSNATGQCNVPSLPVGVQFVELAVGQTHVVARCSNGSVVAWGDNYFGQCNVPPLPAGSSYGAVSAGAFHSAAVVQSGSFATFGEGCAGSLQEATLTALHLPRLGQSMLVRLDHLPQSAAILALGFDNVSSPIGPLPIDLASYGMPGCALRIQVDHTQYIVGAAAVATYALPIPNLPGLVGLVLHEQALVLDPASGNPAGAVMSAAVTAVIGS